MSKDHTAVQKGCLWAIHQFMKDICKHLVQQMQ